MTGAALALSLLLVIGLIGLIVANGLGLFWPREIVRLTLDDGSHLVGQVMLREEVPREHAGPPSATTFRIQLKQGNRDLYGSDFLWVDEARIARREVPPDAVVIERNEWGNFHGFLEEVREAGVTTARGPEEAWKAFEQLLPAVRTLQKRIHRIEKGEIGAINSAQEKIRLRLRVLESRGIREGPEVQSLAARNQNLQEEYDARVKAVAGLRSELTAGLLVKAVGGLDKPGETREKEIPLAETVRMYRPNRLGTPAKIWFFLSKIVEFLWDDPRESNTEGGVFPAIFGTVLMVLLMSIVVTPMAILAAFYLREYARQGPLVSAVRIAVNNLAGVPSIVFGVFGVGFFIYMVGGTIDQLFFSDSLPDPTFGTGGILWAALTLALLTSPVVIVATEEGLAAIPGGVREASLALGATKFETTWRVVLPAVMPSVLTGLILAMARAIGEVAPLMLTGVMKLAPAMPLDGTWPFIHLDRKFMHLGFHIYDVGFQAPNVDAARPMVFATALLLVAIVVLLNFAAILLRNRLRKKYSWGAL